MPEELSRTVDFPSNLQHSKTSSVFQRVCSLVSAFLAHLSFPEKTLTDLFSSRYPFALYSLLLNPRTSGCSCSKRSELFLLFSGKTTVLKKGKEGEGRRAFLFPQPLPPGRAGVGLIGRDSFLI